jgi:GNAT superfamily N-acetyltransferase
MIRPARAADLPALPQIEQAAATRFAASAYPDLVDCELVSTHVDLAREQVWVAVDEWDQPVAFAIAHRMANRIHLHELDVHPDYARRGIGKRLILTVAEWARSTGANALTLTTFNDVPWNGPYYTRLGFRVLAPELLDAALRRVLQAEQEAGMPMAQRVGMQMDLYPEV